MTAPRQLPTGPIPAGEVKNLSERGRWAVAWARAGFPVLPCEGKLPIGLLVKHGFKDASTNEQMVAGWWRRYPDANIGVRPDGLLVLDIDRPLIFQTWGSYKSVPQTALTGSSATKGHIWMRLPDDWTGGIETNLDFGETRANGVGYVIVPPSIHPTTKTAYRFIKGPDIPDVPEGVLGALTKPEAPENGNGAVAMGDFYQLPPHGYEGGRYDAIRSYVAHLYNRKLSVEEMWALVRGELAPRFKVELPEVELRDRFDRTVRGMAERLGAPGGGEGITLVFPEQPDGGVSEALGALAANDFPTDPTREAYDGLVGELVEAALPHTDASKVGLLAAMLTSLGTLMPTETYFYGTHTSSLYTCLVGSSSQGRKGTALTTAENVLRTALEKLYLDLRGSGVNSGEAVVQYLAKQQAQKQLARLLVYEEEYARMLVAAKREGMTTDAILRVGFDGRQLGVMRAATQMQVYAPYVLSALAGITPHELRSTISEKSLTNGSANRWLWIPVQRREQVIATGSQPYVPEALRAAVQKAVSWTSGSLSGQLVQLSVDQPVAEAASTYERVIMGSSAGVVQQLSRRFHVIALRIAMVHATLEFSSVITLEHYRRGVALTEYARRGLGFVFGQMSGNDDADYLYRQVIESANGRIYGRDAAQLFREGVRRQRALDILLDMGMVKVFVEKPTHGSRGGRPRTVIALTNMEAQQADALREKLTSALYPPLEERVDPVVTVPVADPVEDEVPTAGGGWHKHRWASREDGAPFVCATCGLVVGGGAEEASAGS